MKKITVILFALFSFCSVTTVWAQVAINTTGTAADNSAMLDISSDSLGILIPRMAETQRDAVTSPATGLMIYQTDNTAGYYYYDGSSWNLIGSGAFAINDLSDGKTGGSSVFLGSGAGTNDDGTDNQNVAIGFNALYTNTSGYWNTAFGTTALYWNTTGKRNTALGQQALFFNTTGFNNTANGFMALFQNTTGDANTAIGDDVLGNNTTGSKNTAIGSFALNSSTTAWHNTATGDHALSSNTTGFNNTATGCESLFSNTTGNNNTAIGFQAGFLNNTGEGNVFIGDSSGYNNLGGNYNTAVGSWSGWQNTEGTRNAFFGVVSGENNTTGSRNSYFGALSGVKNDTGSYNSFFGYTSGYWNQGSSNTFIGKSAGFYNKGDSSVFLGFRAGQNDTTSNKLYISNSETSYPLVYGEFDNALLRVNGTLDIKGIYQFPITDGTNGQVLKTDGSGTLTWATANGDFSNGGEAGGADRTLGNTDNFALSFKTNNIARIKINDDGGIRFDGNLGIFTDPSDPSSINKSIQLYASGIYSNPYLKISGHNSGVIYLESRRIGTTSGKTWTLASGSGSVSDLDKFSIYNADDGYCFTIRDGGNVGIGTTTPHGQFEVYRNSISGTTVGDFLVDSDNKKVYVGRLSTTPYNSSDFIVRNRLGYETFVVSATNYISLGNYNGANEQMRVVFDGNTFGVGIGTTTPSAKLDINGSTGYDQLRMRTSYTPTSSTDANGNIGDMAWDDNYMYIKTSAGWKRAALSTW